VVWVVVAWSGSGQLPGELEHRSVPWADGHRARPAGRDRADHDQVQPSPCIVILVLMYVMKVPYPW
jgi:hypothetical protein